MDAPIGKEEFLCVASAAAASLRKAVSSAELLGTNGTNWRNIFMQVEVNLKPDGLRSEIRVEVDSWILQDNSQRSGVE